MFLREQCGNCMYMMAAKRGGRLRGLRGRGLGTVASNVGTSLVFGSNPIARTPIGRPVRAYPLGPTAPITPVSTSPTSPVPANPYQPWSNSPTGPIANPGPFQFGGSPGSGGRGGGSWQQGGQSWQSGGQGWQSGQGWSATSSPYGSTPQNPNNSQALAAAQALLSTNPGLLSPQQFSMLQAAGLISSDLPYSEVSSISPTASVSSSTLSSGVNDPNCVAAGCTGGPYPDCTCPAAASSSMDLSTEYAGVPLYAWLIGGALGVYLIAKRR
jgi:hypothetical protein